MKPEVTVCIPAYRAEAFIDRTLNCARNQTFENLRIMVSIDGSGDSTGDICRSHAKSDRRVDVIEHKERLGWVRNANAVLDRVDTEFFFLYFHDDIIEANYVEKLHCALAKRPDAVTAHCDLIEFGLEKYRRPAHAYEGSAFERLVEFFLSPEKGTTLRSLTRNGAHAASLRFPEIPGSNAWSSYPFHLKQLAAGPALAVSEPLYRRWRRAAGMTKKPGWLPESVYDMCESQRTSYRVCLDVLEQACNSADERSFARYCLQVFMLVYTRSQELRLDTDTMVDPRSIFGHSDPKRGVGDLGIIDERKAKLLGRLESELIFLESRIHHRLGNQLEAWMRSAAALAVDPSNEAARKFQAEALREAGLETEARAISNQIDAAVKAKARK